MSRTSDRNGRSRRDRSRSEPPEKYCLEADRLEIFLQRRRADTLFPLEMSLAENLVEILGKANEFVPSTAGSILLDNPRSKQRDRRDNVLTFIAGFGEKSRGVLGRQVPASRGIAGHVYLTGKPYFTSEPRNDPHFFAGVDESTGHVTRSVIAIPIRIEQEVCGVLELVNRLSQESYSEHDRDLLEIFAGHISISIENVLDGRHVHEIAKRDNLTSLYNDRYLHVALSQSLVECRLAGEDLSVLFIDLDFFKRVNDTHGHLAGSQVLREVGQLLSREVALPRAIVARYGGDEFVVGLPGVELAEAVDMAERIRIATESRTYCARASEIQPDPLHLTGITCSVGVATMRRHLDPDLEPDRGKSTLLRLADTAMYVAKETGRNRTNLASEPVPRRRLAAD